MSIDSADTQHLHNLLKRLESKFVTISAVAKHLDIHRAHVHNFMSGKREPSKVLIKALRDKGYLPSLPKRIRSQITWESDEQKEYFQRLVVERGFETASDYCRHMANQRIEWKYVYIGWDAIWKDE